MKHKDSLPEIIWVSKSGFFDFRHIDGMTYNRTRQQFEKDGVKLPTWKRLKCFGKRSDLRVLLSDLTINIKFEGNTGFRYVFNRGYLTDLASVPNYFRSFIDNDDIDIIAAALVHDRNFSVHRLGFRQTNELFYKMFLTRDGVPGSNDKWLSLPIRARLAWAAVSSPVGRLLWKRIQKRRYARATNTSRFSRLTHGTK